MDNVKPIGVKVSYLNNSKDLSAVNVKFWKLLRSVIKLFKLGRLDKFKLGRLDD